MKNDLICCGVLFIVLAIVVTIFSIFGIDLTESFGWWADILFGGTLGFVVINTTRKFLERKPQIKG